MSRAGVNRLTPTRRSAARGRLTGADPWKSPVRRDHLNGRSPCRREPTSDTIRAIAATRGIVAVFFAALLLIGVVGSGTRQLTPEEVRMLVETPMPE